MNSAMSSSAGSEGASGRDLRSDADRPIRFFLPGPSYVLARVREAQTRATMAHRSPEFNRVYETITRQLPGIFRTTRPVVTATGSGTLLLQAAVESCVNERVLHLVGGAFSKRWFEISCSLGLVADKVEVPLGQAIDPDLVRAALRRGRYEAVTLAHSETSTGVLNPLPQIAQVVHEESDALLLVDAISSLAGVPVETDDWGLDVVVTASQKALAMPPGVALASISQRAEDRMGRVSRRGYYTDLARYLTKHRAGGTLSTPVESVYWAMAAQLDHLAVEGLDERLRRHRRMQRRTLDWAVRNGFELAAAEGFGSPTVTALESPNGWSAPDLIAALSQEGYTLGPGYAELAATTFRIGHMGEVLDSDLEGLLSTMEEILDNGPVQASTLKD